MVHGTQINGNGNEANVDFVFVIVREFIDLHTWPCAATVTRGGTKMCSTAQKEKIQSGSTWPI